MPINQFQSLHKPAEINYLSRNRLNIIKDAVKRISQIDESSPEWNETLKEAIEYYNQDKNAGYNNEPISNEEIEEADI